MGGECGGSEEWGLGAARLMFEGRRSGAGRLRVGGECRGSEEWGTCVNVPPFELKLWLVLLCFILDVNALSSSTAVLCPATLHLLSHRVRSVAGVNRLSKSAQRAYPTAAPGNFGCYFCTSSWMSIPDFITQNKKRRESGEKMSL